MANVKGLSALASNKKLTTVILAIAILMATYHIVSTFVILLGNTQHLVTHLSFVLVLGLLIKFRDSTTRVKRYVAIVSILITLIVMPYTFFNADRLEGSFGFINNLDLAIGFALVAIVFAATWLQWGLAVPIMIGITVIYFAFGHLLPGFMFHPQFSAKYLISSLGMSLTTGVFSSLLAISANTIIYFMLFGSMMEAMGVMPAFIEMGKLIGRALRGGPAYIAVFGSGAVSTISGDATGNVAVTGSFTIPAMKASGFDPETAGAIECVSGAGGPITPPVMGAAGFLMAGFLGVPYFTIMQKAVVGAVVYYATIFLGVLVYSYATKRTRFVGVVSGKTILRRLPVFGAGLVITIWLLMRALSVGYACCVAVLAVVILAVILLPETRSLKNILNGIAKGAIWGTQIGIVLSIIGILATAVTGTGLGPKATVALFALTGGSVLPSLLLIAVLAIILGMGIPISAAYSLLAVMLLPGLKQLGVEISAAHFFALYFSVWSVMTPPYAPAALVASRISGGNYWRTGWRSVQFMIMSFVFPFAIALNPTLLNFPNLGWSEIVSIVLTIIVGFLISVAMFGWFITDLNRYTRAIAVVAALGLAGFVFRLGYAPLIIGAAAGAILLFVQIGAYARRRRVPEVSHAGG